MGGVSRVCYFLILLLFGEKTRRMNDGGTTWADRHPFRFVQTDTGNSGARFCGYPQAPDTIDDAARFVVKSVSQSSVFCAGTFLKTSGLTFLLYYRSTGQRWKRQQAISQAFTEGK